MAKRLPGVFHGAAVTVLPVVRVERGDLDLADQRLLPSSNRRNVVELWRVKEEREYAALCADLREEAP